MTKDIVARERISTIEALLAERDRRYTERFDGQEQANKVALEAAEKAVLKAEDAAGRRFDSVNEFRQTLSDQAAQFVTRKEVEALFLGVNATLGRLETGAAASAGRGAGVSALIGYLIGAGGLVIAVAAMVLR